MLAKRMSEGLKAWHAQFVLPRTFVRGRGTMPTGPAEGRPDDRLRMVVGAILAQSSIIQLSLRRAPSTAPQVGPARLAHQ